MYELRIKGTKELVGWCKHPDTARTMLRRSVDSYIVFNPHWVD